MDNWRVEKMFIKTVKIFDDRESIWSFDESFYIKK